MNIRRQLSIGKQIIALPFVALIGFAVVLLILYFGMVSQRLEDEKASQRLSYLRAIGVIQFNLSTARIHEKKFFDTRDTEHIINFQYAVSATLSQIDEIRADKRYASQMPTIESWETDIQSYLAVFHDMVKEIGLVGRFANTGLRGSMRKAVHMVEQRLKNGGLENQILLLELRRREKDVLLREAKIYLTAWASALSSLKLNIKGTYIDDDDKDRILESLNLYELEFNKLRDVLADIQKDKHEVDQISLDLTNTLSTEVLKLETEAANAIMRSSQKTGRQFINAVLLTVLTGAIVFLVGRWVGNGISRPMAIISADMNRLAQGDLEAGTTLNGYTNEFGTMADSVLTFRDNAVDRRRIGFQLLDANRQTQGVFRAMEDALFEVSSDRIILTANPAAEKLLGVDGRKLIGRKLTDFFPDQSKSIEKAQFAQLKKELEKVHRQDTTAFDDLLRDAPISALLVNSEGDIEIANKASEEEFGYTQEGIQGLNIKALIRDEDKQFEQAKLGNSGWMMSQGRKLVAIKKDGTEIEISIGLVPLTLDKKDFFVCLVQHKMLDNKPTNLADMKLGSLFAGIELEQSFEQLVGVASKYQSQTVKMLRADGKTIPVQYTVSALRDDGDEATGAICVVRDVSAQVQSEVELNQFKQALDLSNDKIYMFRSESLEFLYQNKSARLMSGWTREQYLEKTLMDNNSNFDAAEFRTKAKPLHDGTQKQIIYQKTGKNGHPIEVSLQLVTLSDGKQLYLAFTRDITDRLASEKAKSDFISTISHELRTPLTSIKGALGLINVGALGEVNEKVQGLTSMAVRNCDRLERIINDILDTEKIVAGKMNYSFEPVDLSGLVIEAMSANEGFAQTHNVKIRASGIDKPVHISGDPDRLMQILANLISNAAKFSNAGDSIEISLAQSKGKVRLAVKDYGCGIPKSAQPTIFDKFTQADSSDQRSKGGTGLGLSIVKTMVQAHGGAIDFKSTKGKGSEFFINFTLLEAAA